MDVNALQLLRNRIASNRDEAYETLSHVRIHDGQPVIFRYYHEKEDGEQEIRALVAIGYNQRVWGRDTVKIIWDDVYIEDQINLLFKNIERIDSVLGPDFVDPNNPSVTDELERERQERKDADDTLQDNIDAERERALAGEAKATTEVKAFNDAITGHTYLHLEVDHTIQNPGDEHNIYTLKLKDVASEKELRDEEERAANAEADLRRDLNTEINRAKDGETAATTQVARNETDTNTKAHLTVSEYVGDYTGVNGSRNKKYVLTLNDVASATELTAEQNARKDADEALQKNIDAEQTRAEGAEADLRRDLNIEINRGSDGETKATTQVVRNELDANTKAHLTVTSSDGDYTGVNGSKNTKYTLTLNDVASASATDAGLKAARTEVAVNTGTGTTHFLSVTRTTGADDQYIYTLKLDDVASATGTTAAIETARKAATTEVRSAVNPTTTAHMEIVHSTESDNHNVYTIGLKDIAGKGDVDVTINDLNARIDALETELNNTKAWITKLRSGMKIEDNLSDFLQWDLTSITSGSTTVTGLNYKSGGSKLEGGNGTSSVS